ncbi:MULTISPECIES: hypothetical protein [unclassified Bradyrhizobium]|uniref:hypothetical protein n=1 Tax=unclassified Bradyrhizobium TaxID=2631580 RepID=UPI001CD7C474|nr:MULTISPECIES: hypothetical protein [unclassified Bradyrhizobium]MCA1421800.1 hypothetical protein [Bradyrhizobium sp. BRP23]MCA1549781.1 hypothetical protein [Bradyrhizobium sp. BRP19]
MNKEKPFNDALRIALRSRPLALRRVADQLLDKAEQGNLAYIRELVDRLDGKAVQVVDRQDVPIHELSDVELYRIAAGGGLNPDTMLLLPPAKVRPDDPS